MDDKNLMENMLMLEKGVCDLFMHGAIESSTENVRREFSKSLNNSLEMQSRIFSKMQAKGWYPDEQAEQTKINEVKTKFSGASC